MPDVAPLDEVVPGEIFLETEEAARRRQQARRYGNVVTIPRLRIIGFTLLALLGVPLHNYVITRDFTFSTFFTFLIIVELYCTASWVVLSAFYDRVRAFDLGDAFLFADLIVLAGAVYVTGGERSWFFWLPLMRVADQSVHGFRRSMAFVAASTAVFVGLWLYLGFVDGRALDFTREVAKTVFVGVAGFYIALTSRAAERVRAKLVTAIRIARSAIMELKDRTMELAEATRHAQAASQSKSEFLARISHELRRPATNVIGFAQLLEMGELTNKQRDYVGRIARSGQDLGMVIDEVMDLADMQSGMLALNKQEIGIAEVVEEALTQVWPLATARGVRLISTENAEDAIRVVADYRAFRRVLLNIVTHAIRTSIAEDRVIVSWQRAGDRVRVTVRDNGPGILGDPVEEILTTSTRPEDEITRLQELGLGLAFAKALAVAMDGRVGADLEIGHGTTFWIEMPLAASSIKAGRPMIAG